MEEVEEMMVAGEYTNEEEGEEEQMVEFNFTAYEIDLDYEFDAVRYFDFRRPESQCLASRAETWFDSAPSYEPSPFAARLVPRMEMETANASPKSKACRGDMNFSESGSDDRDDEISAAGKSHQDELKDKITSSSLKVRSQQKFQATSQKLRSGFTFYNHMENTKKQSKSSIKPTFLRTTTLMKPTTSQLAKQNRPFQADCTRSLASEKLGQSFASTCVIENQAAKRQKLEGGLLRKVAGAAQLQQTNLVHKAPKREGLPDKIINTKPRITVPKGPDLETACRAQRTRSKNIKEAENATSAVRRFKALPLNRKILEAPSLLPKKSTPRIPDFQEFHFETSERAMQHNSAASKLTTAYEHDKHDLEKCINGSSTTECGNPELASITQHNLLKFSRPDGCLTSQNLKALPVNKKILTSKEGEGNFRSSKKETTAPMDINIQTLKRYPCNNPPVELFNKLSLASDSQPVRKCDPKLPWSIGARTKGSKENRGGFQQVNEITGPAKAKVPLLSRNQQF